MIINENNYEEFLVDYLHNELASDLVPEFELFLHTHPSILEEYILLKETILTPDTDIVFEKKNLLYKEEPATLFPVYWIKYLAIAAVLSGILFIGYTFLIKTKTQPSFVAQPKSESTLPIIDSGMPTPQNKKDSIPTNIVIHSTQQKVNPIIPKVNLPQHRVSPQMPIDIVQQEKKEKQESPNVVVTQSPLIPHSIPYIPNKKEDTIAMAHQEIVPEKNNPIHIMPDTIAAPLVASTDKGLLKLINKVAALTHQIKLKKQKLKQTNLLVFVGNTKILNINNN